MRVSSAFREQAARCLELAGLMADESLRLELLRVAKECWRYAEAFEDLRSGLAPAFADNDP